MGSIPISALCRVVFKLDDGSFVLLRSFQGNIQSSWEILTQFQRRGVVESYLPVDVLELFTWLEQSCPWQWFAGATSCVNEDQSL